MPETPKSKIRNPKSKIVWLLFAAAVVFIYFFGLTIPLVGPDEPRYSQIAREMFERGDWVTPQLGGFDWFEKPALLYWLQIASYKLFGVNEFAARFGSALFGLGTIMCLWILGRFSATENTENTEKEGQTIDNDSFSVNSVSSVAKKDFANWLAIIAASSIGLLAFSRGASFDIILTFPITASLVCYFIFETYLQKHYYCAIPGTVGNSKSATVRTIVAVVPPIIWAVLFLSGFYFFIGVALLAKGLVGIVFPLAVVFFYHLLKFELLPGKIFLISLFWGTIISLLVAAVWYVPMYQANGWKFVDEFFIQHHFQRFTSDKYRHRQPFWFFFVVLPLMTLPWLPFFLAALWKFFKVQGSRFKTQNHSPFTTHHSPLTNFAFAWLAVPLVFFSLSGSKLPGYILPSLPGAIVLTAVYVSEFVSKSKVRERILQITAASTLLIVFIILQFFATAYVEHDTVKNMVKTADAKGFADAEFVSLYTVSHNLEFYAAGRLRREADGKLKRYDDFSVLVKAIKAEPNKRILVVVPSGNVANLQTATDIANIETVAENGESVIILFKPKE